MDIQFKKEDKVFLLLCIALACFAELSFLHGEVGISYPLFLFAFYGLFFWRFRKTKFTHMRIGSLLMVCIWILGLSYFYQFNVLFYLTNGLVIPILVAAQLTLITNQQKIDWSRVNFIKQLKTKLVNSIKYNQQFISYILKKFRKEGAGETGGMAKSIGLGIVIAFPILIIIILLLVSADSHFQAIFMHIPDWLFSVQIGEFFGRLIVIILFALLFYGFLNVLHLKQPQTLSSNMKEAGSVQFDSTIVTTILVLINGVYLLFTIVQFKYFFGSPLLNDMTYASSARTGFAQLLLVTLINWSILLGTLKYVSVQMNAAKRLIQVLLSLLIVFSGVMLTSAFMRLYMYEEAYGYTILRILAHTIMLYLVVIFTYTLVKIWIERIALRHFYFLTGLLFYTGLHIVQLDQLIVDKNISRYKETGKIDLYYLNELSYTGLSGLIDLYESDPNSGELKHLLSVQYEQMRNTDYTWQSYNLSRVEVYDRLESLNLTKHENGD
ncbi:DUF4153 domain-containing protein [Bacillus sp. FJAT-27986]|uniref:DUF4153 domain-containing protein n=1 Tax=Bacillus sp. FJAT-27986 TaxID=1743146 RepID=UPI00080AE279|nr:DUF4173 domain-containing protein [Bacillus sp. FJAT-27986]OCA86900.1 hypothetical protein A8L44_06385 [Bacillus sp. FJAT-27986]